MLNDAALQEQVREVIASTFRLDESVITNDFAQATCARWTSRYHMLLLVALEESFGLTFSMDEMLNLTSLPSILHVLRERHAGAGL